MHRPLVSPIAEPASSRGLSLYRTMLLIRRCEERLAKSHAQGLIHGACHTYVGQEAIATGVIGHLKGDDVVFSTHRGHGHALAKGVAPRELFAELFGRATGCSRGRGGSMHLFAPEIGMMGTSGIVGPSILQAVGAGYSFKLLKSPQVAVAFFGDGAVNNGAFHEGLNMAAIWGLPVLFVCENNQYATEVPFEYAAGNPSVADRGAAYGIPAVEVDGNDVRAVFAAAGEAVDRARAGGGPTLLECKTYRTRAHAEGMGNFGYRTREEVEDWKVRCPIALLRGVLIEEGVTGAQFEAIDAEIGLIVEEAHKFAQSSPWPEASTVAMHVYDENPPAIVSPEPPEPGAREITFIKATHEALASAMERDPRIFVMGEGIGQRGGNFRTTEGLFEKYGGVRLCDTPICERGFVGMACGAGMTGTRPVIDFMFLDFILDSVGEIINQMAKIQYMSSGRLKMPVLLRGCIGIGHSAATHHSGSYLSLFGNIPGLRVVAPGNAYDAKGLFTRALRCNDPVLFLEHREILTTKAVVPECDYEIEFGKARVLREGRDVTVVALSLMAQHALKAAQELAREGTLVELIDPRTVSPLDSQSILRSVAKTGRLLIVDEAFEPFGFGAEIAARIVAEGFDELDAPIRRVSGLHTPTPYSPPLEATVVPNASKIVHAIREFMEE